MIIIGADYHPAFQQITFVDTETGELPERRLEHPEEAEKFYRELVAQGKKVRVGMEASGHARFFANYERCVGFSIGPALGRQARSNSPPDRSKDPLLSLDN